MTFTTRRERIEAEKAAKLAQRSQQSKRFSLGVAGLATAASASLFGMAPANAAIEDVPAPAASSSSTNQSAGTYTVQSGDTLASIANAQGVSLNALLDNNGLSTSSIIYPGDVLQLSGSSSAASSSSSSSISSSNSQSASSSSSSQNDSSSSEAAQPVSANETFSTASASGSKAAVVDKALEIVNSSATYRWGATGPSQYDCSGLTQVAFAAAGIEIPRVTSDQYAQAKSHVSLDNLQPGDLVFWSNNGDSSGIYHVAIYIGDGKIAQARNPQSGITVNSLSEYSKYNPPLNTAARY